MLTEAHIDGERVIWISHSRVGSVMDDVYVDVTVMSEHLNENVVTEVRVHEERVTWISRSRVGSVMFVCVGVIAMIERLSESAFFLKMTCLPRRVFGP